MEKNKIKACNDFTTICAIILPIRYNKLIGIAQRELSELLLKKSIFSLMSPCPASY